MWVGYNIGLEKISTHFILVWRLVSVSCIASMNKDIFEEGTIDLNDLKEMSVDLVDITNVNMLEYNNNKNVTLKSLYFYRGNHLPSPTEYSCE